jgi:hypothetical protein
MNPIITDYRDFLEKVALQSLEYRAKPWEMGIYAGHKGESTHRAPATASGTGTAAAAGAAALAVPGAIAGGPPMIRAMTSKGRGKIISEGIHDIAHGTSGVEDVGRSFVRGVGRSLAKDAPESVKETASAVSAATKNVRKTLDEEGAGSAARKAKEEAGRVGAKAKEKAREAANDASTSGGRLSKKVMEEFDKRGIIGVRDYLRQQTAGPRGEVSKTVDDLVRASGDVRERALKSGAKEGIEAFKKSQLPQILARRAKGTGKAMLVGAGIAAGGKALANLATYETGRALATDGQKGKKSMRKSASADLALAYRNAADAAIARAGFNEHLVKIACAEEIEKIAAPWTLVTKGIGLAGQALGKTRAGAFLTAKAGTRALEGASVRAARGIGTGAAETSHHLAKAQALREYGKKQLRSARNTYGTLSQEALNSTTLPVGRSGSLRAARKADRLDAQRRAVQAQLKDARKVERIATTPKPKASPKPAQPAAPTQAAPAQAAPTQAAPAAAPAQAAPVQTAPVQAAPAAPAAPVAGQQPSMMGWDQFPAQAAQGQAQIPLATRAADWFKGLNNSQLRNNLLLGVGGAAGAGFLGSRILGGGGGGGQQTVVYR